MRPNLSLTLTMMACLLSGCATQRGAAELDEPTISSLNGRQVTIDEDQTIVADEAKALEAYQQFLAVAPKAVQRAEVMRRAGDLEMARADNLSAEVDTSGAPDYNQAIKRYQDYLQAFPNDPANDRVLYQLARAQEQAGDLTAALSTLTRLVRDFPNSTHMEEVQFRRGELLFSARDYEAAESAYAFALSTGQTNQYHDRAVYMQGWSQFKQGRFDGALRSFFNGLDVLLANPDALTSVDTELVEDTFRVISLSLSNLAGAESIEGYIHSPLRRGYAFRVYEHLADLYTKQDRPKDAADALTLFVSRDPLDVHAASFSARVIDIHETAGFANLALQAKQGFVARYGSASAFRSANSQVWEDQVQPIVKTHLTDLARHFHALAQQSKRPQDYENSAHWYREYLAAFPRGPEAARHNFLLAELLFEAARFDDARAEYQKTAYRYPPHDKSADAAYAVLLCYEQMIKTADGAQLPELQKAGVANALRFERVFPTDPRVGPVLADAADKLFAMRDVDQAIHVARLVLALDPPVADEPRRLVWTVLAHGAFEQGAYARAEKGYGEVLALTPANAPARPELVERQAASAYKQGEQAREASLLRDAVGHFTRAMALAPQSAVRQNAQFDAAAAQIALRDWDGAARTLEDFRQRFPASPLQAEVSPKLAVIYAERGQWSQAAGELERLAANSQDPGLGRDAMWQAGEYHEKVGARALAAKAYERYLALTLALQPSPLEPAIEARARLARLAKEQGNTARELALTKDLFMADQSGGDARTDRTRYLGAHAALLLAAPLADAYRKVPLVEPLQKQLKLKKSKMDEALKAYVQASDYGVADVSTAATYHIADLYRDFGKALMGSQRPKKLSKVELEQYNVLLEEQAFPLEERAVELHEVNARRAAAGIYDQWVKSSYEALSELLPVRWGKRERTEGAVNAVR